MGGLGASGEGFQPLSSNLIPELADPLKSRPLFKGWKPSLLFLTNLNEDLLKGIDVRFLAEVGFFVEFVD